MVETNKFKKGILEVIRLSQEINFRIGTYEKHYLTEHATFIIYLSNGTMEVDIDLARDCEENAEKVIFFRLQRVAYSYKGPNKKYKSLKTNGNQWNRMFEERK